MTEHAVLTRYHAKGWQLERGPFTAMPFGHPERCAIVRRRGKRRVLVMDEGRSFGLFPLNLTRIRP